MSKRDKHDLARLERHHEQALHEAQERYCRICGTPNWQVAAGARCEICGGHIVTGQREIHSSDCNFWIQETKGVCAALQLPKRPRLA
jgi:hypothetical protein